MASGKLVNGQCVPDALVKDFFFGQVSPVVTQDSNYIYAVLPVNVEGAWYWRSRTTLKVNGTSTNVDVPAGPALLGGCDTSEEFVDGLTMGWGVVVAMAAVYAVHMLKRAAT